MLLAALKDIGTMTSKRDTIRYISEQHYFNIANEDSEPYPSAVYPEPRWNVLIAWARKDCVTRGCMFDHDENDSWQITRDGIYVYSNCVRWFLDGTFDVKRCYIWTATLKKRFFPTYEASASDTKRPRTLYRDIDNQIYKDLFAGFKL